MIGRILLSIKRRLNLIVTLCQVVLIDDAKKLQRLQVKALGGETLDNVLRLQEYGFTSHPMPGAKAVMLSVGGRRAHTIILGVDDPRMADQKWYPHVHLREQTTCPGLPVLPQHVHFQVPNLWHLPFLRCPQALS